MSRKTYIAMASIVREAEYLTAETRARLVSALVTLFADDNTRFSPARFRAACEPATPTLAVSPRTARYLASCDAGDPVVVANGLIDEALAWQNCGRPDDAEELLALADRVLRGEQT